MNNLDIDALLRARASFRKPQPKSDAESKKYREQGNKLYTKFYINAINCYNKAICYAESSLCLSLAYGNRSAAFFEARKYNECIESIKLARESGFPAEKMGNLDEREQKCIEMLLEMASIKEDPADPWDFFKLSYAANKKIPWIIDGLEMRRTVKYGRGVYTTRDLEVGDIVAIENFSTVFTLRNDDFYTRCANCFKTNMMNLLPCTNSGKCNNQTIRNLSK
jgi:hypothetical protein